MYIMTFNKNAVVNNVVSFNTKGAFFGEGKSFNDISRRERSEKECQTHPVPTRQARHSAAPGWHQPY